MKMQEVLMSSKQKGDKFVRIKRLGSGNMYEGANVLAVPGCNIFQTNWKEMFVGKKVYLAYDNDHPKPHPKTKKLMTPPGIAGMKRAASILGNGTTQTSYMKWGEISPQHRYQRLFRRT